MVSVFNTEVAKRFGINAAVVAEYLWTMKGLNESNDQCKIKGKTWVRCSRRMFTTILPYMTKNMARRALERLMDNGIITIGEFNNSKFDRTGWYTFTEFGQFLMEEVDDEK
jgi:hypothetical protein